MSWHHAEGSVDGRELRVFNFNAQVAASLLDMVLSARPSMNPSPGSPASAEQYLAHDLDGRARMLDEYAAAIEADPTSLPQLLRLHALRLRRVARQMETEPGELR